MIKNEVYQKVAYYSFKSILEEKEREIPKEINPGPNPRYRCCVYHERAVTEERVKMIMGGDKSNKNLVEVLNSACDKCLENRYIVTEVCRGCLAHRCQQSCPVGAISIVNNKAHIDQGKCIECGRCQQSCPYDAIADVKRPCIKVCPTGAISIDENKKAIINNDLCIACGACVYYCPFGAIQDKSQIIQVIDQLKNAENHLYAIVAPAISAQFNYIALGKVITAIKMLGFKDVIEVALGADMVAVHESDEFISRLERGDSFMTSSCCPAFVNYIHQKYPELIDNISSTISPMVATARLVKSIDEEAQVVFIGPCIAKKEEEKMLHKEESVDFTLTFEELTGMIEGMEIDMETLEESPLNNASYYGRNFAHTGGVTKAVLEVIGQKNQDLQYNTMVCDGIQECDKALKLAKAGRLKNTFIEGMACKGGCIKGPVTLHFGVKDQKALEKYCNDAKEKQSQDALRVFDVSKIELD
jgi:[FeFe] hydrogenase (group B1/B3)